MQKENRDVRQEQKGSPSQPELSDVWQELLGKSHATTASATGGGSGVIPTLEIDPWSALLQAKGVEVVDLQTIHLHMSDQEVEQMLQVMQELPGHERPTAPPDHL